MGVAAARRGLKGAGNLSWPREPWPVSLRALISQPFPGSSSGGGRVRPIFPLGGGAQVVGGCAPGATNRLEESGRRWDVDSIPFLFTHFGNCNYSAQWVASRTRTEVFVRDPSDCTLLAAMACGVVIRLLYNKSQPRHNSPASLRGIQKQ